MTILITVNVVQARQGLCGLASMYSQSERNHARKVIYHLG